MRKVAKLLAVSLAIFALPLEDIPAPIDFAGVIQQLAEKFTAAASQVLTAINTSVLVVSREAYITVLLVGVFLYFTHLSRRIGKDLIKGGIILAVLAEFIFPLAIRI